MKITGNNSAEATGNNWGKAIFFFIKSHIFI